jgi:hypothetical protein
MHSRKLTGISIDRERNSFEKILSSISYLEYREMLQHLALRPKLSAVEQLVNDCLHDGIQLYLYNQGRADIHVPLRTISCRKAIGEDKYKLDVAIMCCKVFQKVLSLFSDKINEKCQSDIMKIINAYFTGDQSQITQRQKNICNSICIETKDNLSSDERLIANVLSDTIRIFEPDHNYIFRTVYFQHLNISSC